LRYRSYIQCSDMEYPKGRVSVPAEVLQGVRRAQEADGVNKRSIFDVVASSRRLGETEAMHWLLRHPEPYLRGVSNGFVEEV
jgi:hypothetical protein